MRKDSLKEIQLLRENLLMVSAGTMVTEEMIKKCTIALNVNFFNPFDGLDPET